MGSFFVVEALEDSELDRSFGQFVEHLRIQKLGSELAEVEDSSVKTDDGRES